MKYSLNSRIMILNNLVVLSILLSSILYPVIGQNQIFMFEPNREHKSIKENNVRYSTVYSQEFDVNNEGRDLIHEMTNYYDEEGRIIKEIDHELGDTIRYVYEDGLNIRDVLLSNNFTQESIHYEYNAQGKLMEQCEYHFSDQSGEYILDSCIFYRYYENSIIVNNEIDQMIERYELEDDEMKKIDRRGEILGEYFLKAGEYIDKVHTYGSYIYYYEYRNDGQLRNSKRVNSEGEILTHNTFTYENGLQIWSLSVKYDSNTFDYRTIRYYE